MEEINRRTPTEENQLSPCRKCGGIVMVCDMPSGNDGRTYWVECLKCHLSAEESHDKVMALYNWTKLTPDRK